MLIAKQVIPAGTPGTIVQSEGMYTATTVPKKEVVEGAIADGTYLTGRAAAVEVVPGDQLTAADFAAATTTTVDSQITGRQRALSISIDAIHGSLGQIKPGDEVDIYMRSTREGTGAPQVELFREAVKILAVPGPTSPGIILRTTTRDAPKFAYAADNVGLWFILRPAAGAKRTADVVGHADNLTTRPGR